MADRTWDKLNYKRFEHIEDSSESDGDGHPNIEMESWKRMKKRMREEKGLPPRGVELHDAYATTKVNRMKKTEEEELTEKQVEEYFANNKKNLDKYSMMMDDEKSNEFLSKHPEILSTSGEGYLITRAVDNSCEGEPVSLTVPLIAKRCLTVHNILASAKDSNMKPKVALEFFLKKQKDGRVKEIYDKEFNKQYEELLGLIKKRTKERKAEEAAALAAKQKEMKELTAEEAEAQKAPLGPGGLDPTEVLNELPESMQNAFMSKDMPALQKAIAEMPKEEAAKWMDKCVKSGLWVPGPDEE